MLLSNSLLLDISLVTCFCILWNTNVMPYYPLLQPPSKRWINNFVRNANAKVSSYLQGLGFSPFARHYLGNSFYLVSFLPATEMFHFAGLPSLYLYIQYRISRHDSGRVSPFGNSRIKAFVVNYPGLIADCHVLLRLFVPRHSPYTLNYLLKFLFSNIDLLL